MKDGATRRAAIIAALLVLGGAALGCPSRCGSVTAGADDAGRGGSGVGAVLSLPANALPVPLVRQRTSFSCGDVAALAILRYWDAAEYASVPESALYGPLDTTASDGTDPAPIVAYLGSIHGLSAELRLHATLEDLTTAIDRGEPVIVDFQAWKDEPRAPDMSEWAGDWDDGHYAVLVGYDARALYFMDPSTSDHYAYVPRGELDARWHDTLIGSNAHIEHAAILVHAGARSSQPPARVFASREATPLL